MIFLERRLTNFKGERALSYNRGSWKHGDLVVNEAGLIGRIHVNNETHECEIRSVSYDAGQWVVRVSSLNDISNSKRWRRYPT